MYVSIKTLGDKIHRSEVPEGIEADLVAALLASQFLNLELNKAEYNPLAVALFLEIGFEDNQVLSRILLLEADLAIARQQLSQLPAALRNPTIVASDIISKVSRLTIEILEERELAQWLNSVLCGLTDYETLSVMSPEERFLALAGYRNIEDKPIFPPEVVYRVWRLIGIVLEEIAGPHEIDLLAEVHELNTLIQTS